MSWLRLEWSDAVGVVVRMGGGRSWSERRVLACAEDPGILGIEKNAAILHQVSLNSYRPIYHHDV